MRIIEPKVEYLPQEGGLQGIYKQIEIAGHTCNQNQDKITEDSAKKFTEMLIKNQHLVMLEHAAVYLKIPIATWSYLHYTCEDPEYDYEYYPEHICTEKYSKMKIIDDKYAYISTNYRVLVEHHWLEDLRYLCEPTEYHEKRYTFKFTTNIGISHEFNKHRVNSTAEENTYLYDYNKGKFGNEITYIQPRQFDKEDYITFIEEWDPTNKRVEDNQILLKSLCSSIAFNDNMDWRDIDYWMFATLSAEYSYMGLINQGWKPQDARCALNLNTKTELVHTAFESDWKHFCELRCAQNAHLEAQVLANQIKDVLKIEL